MMFFFTFLHYQFVFFISNFCYQFKINAKQQVPANSQLISASSAWSTSSRRCLTSGKIIQLSKIWDGKEPYFEKSAWTVHMYDTPQEDHKRSQSLLGSKSQSISHIGACTTCCTTGSTLWLFLRIE